jgi:hypothetical protein
LYVSGTPLYIAEVASLSFVASFSFVFVLVTAKGIERKDIGLMGEIVDGIDVFIKGIGGFVTELGFLFSDIIEHIGLIASVFGLIATRFGFRLKKVFGLMDGSLAEDEERAQARPPPYDVSGQSISQASSDVDIKASSSSSNPYDSKVP